MTIALNSPITHKKDDPLTIKHVAVIGSGLCAISWGAVFAVVEIIHHMQTIF